MEQNLVVLQGKVFTVDIQSMIGSTNYGWCLTSLPPEMILIAAENITSGTIGPVTQRFYLGAVSKTAVNVDIHFALMCWSDFTQVADTFTAHVSTIPGESVNYTPYSENAYVKYGYPCNEAANMKYGYPCGQAEIAKAAIPYGVVFNGNDTANTPFFNNAEAVNTPFFNNAEVVNTPFFNNAEAVNTPFFNNAQAVKTPFFNNAQAVNTPFFNNAEAVNTPFFNNAQAVKTPFFNNAQAVKTPFFSGSAPVLKYGFPGCC